MAKKIPDNKKEFYSNLIIYKSRRRGLFFMLMILYAFFAVYLFNHSLRDLEWTSAIGPSLVILTIIMIFPMTEDWQYRPWQNKPQRYERHHSD